MSFPMPYTRVIRPLGDWDKADAESAKFQKRREYNRDYYRRVRSKKLSAGRKRRAATLVIEWFERQLSNNLRAQGLCARAWGSLYQKAQRQKIIVYVDSEAKRYNGSPAPRYRSLICGAA